MAEFAGNAGKIHYRDWTPAEPRVLAVFFHGLGEHIGSYEPFAAALNDAGVALWAHDHAGHGRSDGVRVLIKDVDDLLDDASILLDHARSAHPGLPLVLIGHSLGSTVATLLTGERLIPAGTPPRKLVLTGSSLVPSADSGLVALLSTGMDPLDLRKDPGEMTRDTAYADQIRNDPLTWQGGLRLETLQALGIAAGRVSTVLPALDLPILLVHGAKDDIAPVTGTEQAARILPNAQTAIFPDDLHNILNELDRENVYRTIIDFIRK